MNWEVRPMNKNKVTLKANAVDIESKDYGIYIDNNSLEELLRMMIPKGTKIVGNLVISIEPAPERIQFEGLETINIESEEN